MSEKKLTNKHLLFIVTGASCSSPITLLDTSNLSPAQAARIADNWIMEKIL